MNEEQFNEQFAKLYAYMDRRFDGLEKELKSDIANLRDTMDERFDHVVAKLDDLDTEVTAMQSQLDRHERWHHQVADHVRLTLRADA
ncbi:hypothetical protein H0264_35775 [Nocardia huaxiensis]|uniref:Uncharacterized protein n=1 Tax=Nocardia huaxiensis TaxID=2755382 RepID=A0A7D6Z3V3_9NOCA|nr:hypothetical protein [Nocardia huaxiensis]QLY30424.1 hypothetical protein H0264_35775 [Nocardia huaxiensis]